MGRSSRSRFGRVAALVVAALVLAGCDLLPPEGPGPLRFRDEVFTSVEVTSNQVYGQAVDQEGVPTTLRFDLYEPAGDTMAARPLVIWVHGGSFAFGSKTSPELVDQANVMARKGYVSASISYRLSDRGCTVVDAGCLESMIDATEDAQAAVRYFRANAAAYGIDPDRIAMAGTSAGAITALHVAYQLDVPGNSGTPGESSSIGSAVSLSGAAVFRNAITADDVDTLMFHGTADAIVPYAWAQNTARDAGRVGLEGYIVAWDGEGHVPYLAHRTQIIDLTTNFLYNTLDLNALQPE